jgi:4'-phosphopantetheinyl transferase
LGTLDCGPDEIHVWRISLDVSRPELQTLEAVLTPDEQLRANRFATDELRNRWMAGQGALRMILGVYSDISASDVAFTANDYGKPQLARAASPVFNLSHTDGRAFAAVALCGLLGIDAETERPDVDWVGISRHYFSPAEADEIAALPPDQRLRAGYACWTRKEGYVKALGVGLHAALDAFQVSVLPNESPRLVRVLGDNDEPGRWTFVDLSEPGITVSMAARKARVFVRRFTFAMPLRYTPEAFLSAARSQ